MKAKIKIMAVFFAIYAAYMGYACHGIGKEARYEGQQIYEDKFCMRYPDCTKLHMEGSSYCAAHQAERDQNEYDYWHEDPKELEEKAAMLRKNHPDVEWQLENADDLEERAAIIRNKYSGGTYSSDSDKKHISSGSSRTNVLDYDPDDYDTPDDYADDAVGNDFDEWEDAYEYWEEVE